MKLLFALTAAAVLCVVGASDLQAVGSASLLRGRGQLGDEAGCTAAATRALVRPFVRDYDGGKVAVIDRLWAREPYFQWFSTRAPGARLDTPAYERSTLASYFRSRARVHENLRLTELSAGYDPERNIINFHGRLIRSADDLRPALPQEFKGAAACVPGGPILIVWGM